MDAYLGGLEQARDARHRPVHIQSVASFFVSRVDTEVDERLDEIGTDDALALQRQGRGGQRPARLRARTRRSLASDRWKQLADAGANAQRPLWASTGVKNPDYPDTLYVTDLVVADTVNTMPEKTMDAFADHGEVTATRSPARPTTPSPSSTQIEAVGIDLTDVFLVLENEGVEKFKKSWTELVETVRGQMEKAGK